MSEPLLGSQVKAPPPSPTLQVLGLFTETQQVVSEAEIVNTLKRTPIAAAVYINSLVRGGYIEECAGGFHLGPRVLDLARLARRRLGLSSVALPWMRHAAAQLNQVVLLGSRFGDKVLCSEVVSASAEISEIVQRGAVFPLNFGAGAYVLLAWLPDSDVDDILRRASLRAFSDRAVTDVATMKARLAVIREQGYGVSRGEIDPNLGTVAVPIRGIDGRPRAALATVGPTVAMTDEAIPKMAGYLLAAASEIRDRLSLLER